MGDRKISNNQIHTLDVLIMIGNLLGKTIALDARNVKQAFQVRICIKIDLCAKLSNFITINHHRFQVCFENLHSFLPSPTHINNVHRPYFQNFRQPKNHSCFLNFNPQIPAQKKCQKGKEKLTPNAVNALTNLETVILP